MKIQRRIHPLVFAGVLIATGIALAQPNYAQQVDGERESVQDTPAIPQRAVKVTVHLYSGRPDPVFFFNATEAQTLNGLIDGNTVVSPTPFGDVLPSRLGYKGMTIERLNRRVDLPKVIELYRSKLVTREGDTTVSLVDRSAIVERFLKEKAVDKGVVFPANTFPAPPSASPK